MDSPERRRPDEPSSSAGLIVPAVVVVALVVLLWSAVDTASARFVGSTSNEQSLLEAVAMEVEVSSPDGSTSALAIDADGMYPGQIIERCVAVDVTSSVGEVDLRLHGSPEPGNTLDEHLLLTIETGRGVEPTCADFEAVDAVQFDGSAATFFSRHGDHVSGIRMGDGSDTIVLRVRLGLADTDDAQGGVSRFWLIAEARP